MHETLNWPECVSGGGVWYPGSGRREGAVPTETLLDPGARPMVPSKQGSFVNMHGSIKAGALRPSPPRLGQPSSTVAALRDSAAPCQAAALKDLGSASAPPPAAPSAALAPSGAPACSGHDVGGDGGPARDQIKEAPVPRVEAGIAFATWAVQQEGLQYRTSVQIEDAPPGVLAKRGRSPKTRSWQSSSSTIGGRRVVVRGCA